MPHGLPMASSIAAARVSANSAAPGFRTIMAASGPANSQMPFSRPSKPGVTASNSVIGAAQITSQPQKITPDATAMMAATTISTTRHLLLCFFTTEDSFTVMNVPFSMPRHGKERRPCAGITRYTFIRSKRLLPLSHTAPVSAIDTTQGTRFSQGPFHFRFVSGMGYARIFAMVCLRRFPSRTECSTETRFHRVLQGSAHQRFG